MLTYKIGSLGLPSVKRGLFFEVKNETTTLYYRTFKSTSKPK